MAGWRNRSYLEAISERDLWVLTAQRSEIVIRHVARDYARDNAVPEESPVERSRTLKTDRLREPGLLRFDSVFQVLRACFGGAAFTVS